MGEQEQPGFAWLQRPAVREAELQQAGLGVREVAGAGQGTIGHCSTWQTVYHRFWCWNRAVVVAFSCDQLRCRIRADQRRRHGP